MKREIKFEARGEIQNIQFTTTGGGRDLISTCSHWELIFDLEKAGEVVRVESECWRLPVVSPSERAENQKAVRQELIAFGEAEGRRLAIKDGRSF